MIQVNELRIFNWVYSLELGKNVKITSISDDGIISFGEITFDYPTIECIKPIHITEEILLNCGFEKGLKYFSYKDFDIDLKGWFGFNNMVANANIKHLHQLQNLYFALTNQELNIKL